MKYLFLSTVVSFCISLNLSAQIKLDSIQLIKDAQFLSLVNDKHNSNNNENALNYFQRRFEESGIQKFNASYLQTFYYKEKKKRFTGTNLIGQIKGSNDSIIVISAYYNFSGSNHDTAFTKPFQLEEVHDNASGVAALLAIANYFKKQHPYYTLLLVILDGNGSGQSRVAFMNRPPVLLNKIKLNVRIGEIGNNDKGELFAIRSANNPGLEKALMGLDNSTSIHLRKKEIVVKGNAAGEKKQPIQYSFFNNNIPFIYFHSDENNEPQKFTTLNPSFYYSSVQIIKDLVEKILWQSGFLKNQIPPRSKWIMKSKN